MKEFNYTSLSKISVISKLIFMGLLSVFVMACTQKLPSSHPDNEIVVYPDPPDTARIQYLTSFSSSKDVERNRGALKRYVLGEKESRPIIKPYGAAMFDGKIYLCDLDLEGLEIIDLESGTFEYFLPKGLGKLQLPLNCSFDSVGNLYVADVKRKQIVVFNKDLEYVNSFSHLENFKPTDVFVTGDSIWVCNISDATIDVFRVDSNYTYLFSFPESSSKKEKMYQPTNLFVDDTRVYVSDFGEFNIKIFDHAGNKITNLGSYGKNLGQFARPKGIAVDKKQNLYVVDAAFENIQIFDKQGRLLMFFGGSYRGHGGMWLPAKVAISYDFNSYFKKYVDDRFDLNYIILVTNNFGPDKVSIYGNVRVKTKGKK